MKATMTAAMATAGSGPAPVDFSTAGTATPSTPGEGRVVTRAAVRRMVQRWSSAVPFVAVGAVSIVAGGLVAAVARPTGFEMGSWLAAFLVLVAGVAQIGFGAGQAWLADEPPRPDTVQIELASFNLGLVGTAVGSIASLPLVTTLSAIPVVLALGLFLREVLHSTANPRWVRVLYQGLVALVLLSTPVGLILAWLRHG
ncbi:MAG: hypothetical protein R2698_09385 [Microthrixaceae bacterium]